MSSATPDYRALITKALAEIKELKARVRHYEDERAEPIAVIGMACRFPGGANSPDGYWDLLRNGVDAIREVPSDRWDVERYFDADRNAPGKTYSRWGGFIDDVGGFDAAFFGISPREAESLDVHQRILLEVCWEALEDANLIPEKLFGSNAGVFVGVSCLDQILTEIGQPQSLVDVGPYHGTGCALSPIAGRISYNFGFNGPSFVVDTACSSSLLSLHLAAESLRRRECDLALGGGVHLLFHPGYFVAFSKASMLSPNGRCKTFDASADGYVRGEGCGVVVLKRLSDAQRDGDNIVGLLRGSAVNQDGASGGLTVPSGPSQEQVVRQALARAGIDASKVSYVEAHGTGTSLGDPIEIGSLSRIFKQTVHVGSVKTNFGHLEASAGIASFIKVMLALQHRQLPPHLHFRQPSAMIPWADISIKVPTELTPWTPPDHAERIAGMNSFGFSGTNVHVVVSEPPARATRSDAAIEASQPSLLALSARSDEALRALAARWAQSPALNDADLATDFSTICATVVATRTPFQRRLTVVAADAAAARASLQEFAAHGSAAQALSGAAEQSAPKVAFLFTGQGSQYLGMGQALYAREPVFRAAMDECDALLRPELGFSLLDLLYRSEPQDAEKLNATANTQPALFAVEYALARLWQSWGVEAAALIGHSVGEYVAACLAGVFSLADGVRLIAARARLMQALPAGGAMAAIFADPAMVEARVAAADGDLAIAAYNGPRNIVISGSASALEPLLAKFAAEGVECRRLTVSHAFHSPLMEPMLEEFRRVAQTVKFNPPQLTVISNVSGRQAGAELATADYWVRHVRAAVRFADGVRTLVSQGHTLMIEVGPSATLIGMARQTVDDPDVMFLPSLRRDRDARDARETLLLAAGGFWLQGGELNWSAVLGRTPDRSLHLPTYAFQHRTYWKSPDADKTSGGLHGVVTLDLPLLGRRFGSPLLRETLFETLFSKKTMPFVEDHRVFGQLVVAGASHLSLVLSATEQVFGRGYQLTEVLFPMALVVPEDGERAVQLAITPESRDLADFRLVSLIENSAEPALHAKGQIRRGAAPQPTPDLRAIWQRCALERPVSEVYELQRQRHIVVGPSYQWLVALRCGENEAMARLCAPAILTPVLDRYSLHPGLIDSCFGVLVITQQIDVDETFIPFAAGALQIHRPVGADALLAYAVVRQSDRLRLVGDIHLYTEEGEPVASFIGLEGRRASRNALLQQRTAHAPATYRLAWEALAAPPNPLDGSWLLFSDANGPGAEIAQGLAQRLRAQGSTVVLARSAIATGWRVNAEDDYSVAPHEPEDMHKLLAQCGALDRIVYLWGLGYAGSLHEEEDWRAYQQQALAGALHLSQALATRKVGAGGTDVRVCWLTQGAQAALPSDAVPAPHQAALWGMAHTLAQEAPGVVCATVDLQPETTASQSVADLMLALAAPAAETRLVCRQGEVHAARLDAFTVGTRLPQTSPLLADACYLITGAQGALGRVLVDWLAEQGVRHLALLGRSSADTEWLQSLEQRGLQARWYRVDVADYAALQAALAAIRQQQAPLGGVFHLAGQVDDGLIGGQNWPRFGQVLAAKAQGAWNLHRLIPQPEVLFVNFASVAGLLGSAGQASYAAANAVLDALAQQRRAMGLSGLSVDWGPWAEVGMAARLDEAQRARLESIGVSGIVPSQGLAILSALIDADSGAPAQVGVLALDWTRYTRGRVGPFLSRVAEVQTTDEVRTLRQQWQEIKPAERRALLLNELIARVAEVLRLSRSEVAPRQRLFDLGVDSLIAVELKNRLETLLGMTLSTTLLFDYPTIEALADYLMELLGEADRPTAATDAVGATTTTAFVGSVDDLSEDQAEAELLAQLALLEQAGN